MQVEIKASEILEYVREGQDCKIEIAGGGAGCVLPLEAYGYDDTIFIQSLEAELYEEIESEADFISWLKDAYKDVELEASSGQIIKIEII